MAASATKKLSRSLSPADRDRILRQSLEAPSLTQLAHNSGITAQYLYNLRQRARDGEIETSADIRESLARQMPGYSSGPRKPAIKRKSLSRTQAQDVVVATIRRRKTTTLASIAERNGISINQLTTLRARARDGLIKIPAADLAVLRQQMSEQMRASRSSKQPITVKVTESSKPTPQKATSKPLTKAAQPQSSVQSAEAKARSTNADVIVVRRGDHAIEIPVSLDVDRISAVVTAAMAA